MKPPFKKICIASDHAGFKYKSHILDFLISKNYSIIDLGPQNANSVDYPDYAKKVSNRIKSKKKDFIAKINVLIKNKIGALGELSSIIGQTRSNIRNLKITDRTNDFFKLNIEIDVKNKDHLNKVLGSLRTSEFIETVTRI